MASASSPRTGWCSRRCRPATTCASAAARSRGRWRCSPSWNRGCRCGAGCCRAASSRCWRLARALSRNPSLLLADELSLGLAPKIVDRLLGAVRTAADERGTGALIVEQHAHKALKYADRMYLMARGQILLDLPAAEALARMDEIEDAYLRGTSETEEDHIERLRRKNKRKQWKRQRVRERELERLTGKIASTRRAEDDDLLLREGTPAAFLCQAREEVADHGLQNRRTPTGRTRRVRQDPVLRADEDAAAPLGGVRLRHSEADDQLLRVEDLLLRAVRADHLRRVHQGAGVRQHRRLVGRTDPLPEADGLDDPAGDPRARRHVRSAGVPLRSADRRRPVLVAERHASGSRRTRTTSRSRRATGGRRGTPGSTSSSCSGS